MKISQIVKYLLQNNCDNSRTWTNRIRQLAQMYGLQDPLISLSQDPPPKSTFKEEVMTKITVYHERKLRENASTNSKMQYLNVYACNLRGQAHPSICNVTSVEEARQMRPHLKMLSGDYFTMQVKSQQSGGDPNCKLCLSTNTQNIDSISHILVSCLSLSSIRDRIMPEIEQICQNTKYFCFDDVSKCEITLSQFLLDPSSLNLTQRVHVSDIHLTYLFKKIRNLCWALHNERKRKL